MRLTVERIFQMSVSGIWLISGYLYVPLTVFDFVFQLREQRTLPVIALGISPLARNRFRLFGQGWGVWPRLTAGRFRLRRKHYIYFLQKRAESREVSLMTQQDKNRRRRFIVTDPLLANLIIHLSSFLRHYQDTS